MTKLTTANQPPDNFIKSDLRFGFDLFLSLILNRMRNVDRIQIGSPQRARLCTSRSDEFGRRYRD